MKVCKFAPCPWHARARLAPSAAIRKDPKQPGETLITTVIASSPVPAGSVHTCRRRAADVVTSTFACPPSLAIQRHGDACAYNCSTCGTSAARLARYFVACHGSASHCVLWPGAARPLFPRFLPLLLPVHRILPRLRFGERGLQERGRMTRLQSLHQRPAVEVGARYSSS